MEHHNPGGKVVEKQEFTVSEHPPEVTVHHQQGPGSFTVA